MAWEFCGIKIPDGWVVGPALNGFGATQDEIDCALSKESDMRTTLTEEQIEAALQILIPERNGVLTVEIAQRVFDAVGIKEEVYKGMLTPPWLMEILSRLRSQ